ncbi:hypothetical protein RB195_016801 [Necator americanus]
MSDGVCEISIDLPHWVPAAIAFGLAIIIAIAVCIAYVAREMERHKTFYGREDKLSSREEHADAKKKEEMDAYALGRCSHEVLVIKSPPQATPGAVPGTAPSGVKVMLRKKKVITKTPSRPLPISIPTSLEPESPNILSFTVVYDKTGRAFELIDLIRKEPPVVGSRSKRVDWLLHEIKCRLETMTDHHYIVYGCMDQIWIVKGLENLQENVEGTSLEMRLNVDALDLKILAYKIQAISAEQAMLLSRRGRTSELLRPEPTQVTPSRWVVPRGAEATPRVATVPQSRKRSAEGIEQDRRSKEMLLHAAKTLRQAIHSSPTEPAPGSSFSSHNPTLGATDKKSLTRRSQNGLQKRPKSNKAGSSMSGTGMSHPKSREKAYMQRAIVDLTPTKIASKDSPNHPMSSGHKRSPMTGVERSHGVEQEEGKLSEAITQTTLRKTLTSKEKRPNEGTNATIKI